MAGTRVPRKGGPVVRSPCAQRVGDLPVYSGGSREDSVESGFFSRRPYARECAAGTRIKLGFSHASILAGFNFRSGGTEEHQGAVHWTSPDYRCLLAWTGDPSSG